MHQNEVGRATFTNNPRVGIPADTAATPARGGKCFQRVEAGVYETLHLPGQLVRAGRTATEVGTRCDQYARRDAQRERSLLPSPAVRGSDHDLRRDCPRRSTRRSTEVQYRARHLTAAHVSISYIHR